MQAPPLPALGKGADTSLSDRPEDTDKLKYSSPLPATTCFCLQSPGPGPPVGFREIAVPTGLNGAPQGRDR